MGIILLSGNETWLLFLITFISRPRIASRSRPRNGILSPGCGLVLEVSRMFFGNYCFVMYDMGIVKCEEVIQLALINLY